MTGGDDNTETDLKKCSRCELLKPISEFGSNRRMKDGRDYYCKQCRRVIESSRGGKYHANREYVESLKTPCVKCGETRSYIIQFHHIDPSKKRFHVTLYGTRSQRSILNEAKKCVCLCSNCHDEFHWFYGKSPVDPDGSLREYLGDSYKLTK